ncbi:low-density lipoprotein receptor class A domain-containing protein 1-like isoform X1 [Oncorhynchus keta]|uniref:low-density lipoprotein receptor class A domain-containing protein 1-like isoform X1 n=1 Tax=Oncorhynchus keta TaxID=8018 RepID=UPI00227A7FB7|nr:low-density lipoprotein receptor class A domain-containing protein 1-like isoform X1 [Oncorhynchus keta]
MCGTRYGTRDGTRYGTRYDTHRASHGIPTIQSSGQKKCTKRSIGCHLRNNYRCVQDLSLDCGLSPICLSTGCCGECCKPSCRCCSRRALCLSSIILTVGTVLAVVGVILALVFGIPKSPPGDLPNNLPGGLVFRCGNPQFWVFTDKKCNNFNDCGDCSDEIGPYAGCAPCGVYWWPCIPVDFQYCSSIPRCLCRDGRQHCYDWSDEYTCPKSLTC